MIEKVKGLSICGRCFSKKTNLAFFPNDNDRIAIVYGKNGSGKSTISDGFSQIASGEDTEELSASAAVILFGNCRDLTCDQFVPYHEQYELFHPFPQEGIWYYPGDGDYRYWILQDDLKDRNPVWYSGRPLYFSDLQSCFSENHGLLYGTCSTIPAFYSKNSERNHGSGYDIKYCDCGHSSQHSSEKDCEIEYHK